jgi:ABC-type transporter MlaC component
MRRTSSRYLAGTVLVAAMLCACGAGAAANPAVDAFVDRINATTGAASPGDKSGIRAACEALVTQAFDFDALAPAASYDSYKRMNQTQKAAYRGALVDSAVDDCAKRGRDVAGKKVGVIGIRDGKGGEFQLAVQAASGQGRVAIWKVKPDGSGKLRALDITVDGRSMVAFARNQARQILADTDGNLNALIRAVGG